MVKMIALSRFFLHEGKQLRVGEEFETTDENAADLVAVQRAERAPLSAAKASEPASRSTYRTRNMRAQH